MAAVKVQNYLKKHKIGPLFESLMARVIQDTPDDPIGFIIKVLQGIHKKQSKQLESSFNGHMSPRPSSRQSSHSENKGNARRTNHLAASWSAGVTQQETRKQENQLRTWTGNDFQSVKNKTWASDNHTDDPQSQAPWNNDTRVPTHDFDELFQMQNEDATHEKASQKQPQEKYRGVRSRNGEEKRPAEQKIAFQPDDNDEFNRELRLGSKPSANFDPTSPISSGSRPIKTSKRAVEKHRQELQALLLEDSRPGQQRKSIKQHSPEEGGTEILEKMEDLQYEGVNNASRSLTGAKLDKLRRDGNKDVSVTICARCARIIGDKDDMDSSSQAASSDFNSRLFDDITRKQDLDKIDSVSESEASVNMSLREKNTWPITDSEHELTPRNNTVSFNKTFDSFSPKESKHMFNKSSDIMDDDSPVQTQRSSRTQRSSQSRSSNFDFTNSARNGGWRLDDNGSDESDYADMMQQRRPRSQASGSIKGRAWNRNSGNISDDDSTIT